MQDGRDKQGGDGDKAEGAAKATQIEGKSAHQWNICAEPGW
jgi:hypothetical protein